MDANELTWFEEEHDALDRRLPQFAAAIAQAKSRRMEIASLLAELARALPEHLDREEREIYPEIAALLPEEGDTLDGLARQHVHILSLVSTLQHCAADEQLACNLQEFGRRFLRLLEEHGAAERALVERAKARP